MQGLFEEDKTNPAQVDEAFATWHPSAKVGVMAGRKYIPFGAYQSAMISDPLTADLTKTRADTIQVLHKGESLKTGAFIYQGHTQKLADNNQTTGDKRVDWGVNADYQLGAVTIGAGYISNIAAAKDRYDPHNASADATHKPVGAWGYHMEQPLFSPKVKMVSEQIFALNTYKPGDLGGAVNKNLKPTANNTELDVAVGTDSTVAVSVQGSTHAAPLGIPNRAVGIAFRKPLYKKVGFATEYLKTDEHDDHYTAQVEYAF